MDVEKMTDEQLKAMDKVLTDELSSVRGEMNKREAEKTLEKYGVKIGQEIRTKDYKATVVRANHYWIYVRPYKKDGKPSVMTKTIYRKDEIVERF